MVWRTRLARLETAASYLALLLAGAFALWPVYWAVNTSLKPEPRIVRYPPGWWPDPVTVSHYVSVLTQSTMPRNYLNSAILAASTIVLVLLISTHAGYAAARFEFRGKNAVLFLLLAPVMVPGIVTLIPLHMIAVQLGLHDTFVGLILVFSA